MNGVPFLVHQSSRRNESRKLVSTTRSASVAVVSEIAPRWMTASSLRWSSQAGSAGGATMSASWRLARLRHLPPAPSSSQTATSARPASLRPATTFDPMNPAPPVTNSIPAPQPWLSFARERSQAQRAPGTRTKYSGKYLDRLSLLAAYRLAPPAARLDDMNLGSN